ncbi:MAG TPA: ribonuclease domain-containing protein [Rhodocyclaceae bacterium]|nr:ribonuclease domain-containing protein [Rhodocyclaceae bacterium]
MRSFLVRFVSGFSLSLLLIVSAVDASPALARESITLASVSPIAVSDLPREAQVTLALIRHGGPFPNKRDGVVFQNRERRLPPRQPGYYREYTVATPHSRDRGARRIIAGATQEYYYTNDHYRSFRRIRTEGQRQ